MEIATIQSTSSIDATADFLLLPGTDYIEFYTGKAGAHFYKTAFRSLGKDVGGKRKFII